jgi:putative ABC transport system permease protein
VWKERVPYRPFEYHFLDDDYNALYKVEARTAQIFTVFSITAVVLACLGLFALAAYHAAQRAREIGIRKVLGASVLSITGLLSKEFFRLVALACLIAFPLAWWASHQWLQNFAYRINLQWWVFPIAAAIAIVIALATVSVQAIKAGLANPASTLRKE